MTAFERAADPVADANRMLSRGTDPAKVLAHLGPAAVRQRRLGALRHALARHAPAAADALVLDWLSARAADSRLAVA